MRVPSLHARPRVTLAAGLAVLVFVLEVCGACGPGRGYNRRRSPRKLNPLVFKQHVPNVHENAVIASGKPEGAITRDNPRFKELIPNFNSNIQFRDEEGTGIDRLMSPRCKEKLDILAISVMNFWPGIKLRVTEAFDEEGYHSKQSLHGEGRAVDITTSDKDRSKYGILARLAVESGFDFVYYSSKSHVHCSVKSESVDAARFGGCFAGSATVLTRDGPVKMSDLHLGDSVLVVNSDGTLDYSEVIMFLDRDDRTSRYFMNIETDGGARLTVTPSHLIFIYDGDSNRTIDISEGYATLAKFVEIGDYIYVSVNDTSENRLALQKVRSISEVSEIGAYAPLTKEGNVIVNNVVASCYAVLNDQATAHSAFFPVRLYNNCKHALLYLLKKLHFLKLKTARSDSVQHGVHWYPRLLYKIFKYILPARYIYL